MQAQVIDAKVVAKERKKDFEISRLSRFWYQIQPVELKKETPKTLLRKNFCEQELS